MSFPIKSMSVFEGARTRRARVEQRGFKSGRYSGISRWSPLDTLALENPLRGEGDATERHPTETHHPKTSKPPPGMHGEDLQESGGVLSVLGNPPTFPGNLQVDPLRLAGTAQNADAGEVEPSGVDAHG